MKTLCVSVCGYSTSLCVKLIRACLSLRRAHREFSYIFDRPLCILENNTKKESHNEQLIIFTMVSYFSFNNIYHVVTKSYLDKFHQPLHQSQDQRLLLEQCTHYSLHHSQAGRKALTEQWSDFCACICFQISKCKITSVHTLVLLLCVVFKLTWSTACTHTCSCRTSCSSCCTTWTDERINV